MSVRAASWAVRVAAGDITAKCVLIILAEAANDKGETFIGQQTIAERCDIRRETVCRAMGRLEKLGLITRGRRKRADGSRTSDLIRLRLCAPDAQGEAGNVIETRGQCAPKRTAEPSLNLQIKNNTSSGKEGVVYPEAFEAVWKAYPHFRGRSDKTRACLAYARLGGEEQASLARAIGVFRETPTARQDNGQYVKAFERWISADLWRDFVKPETPPGPDWALRVSLWRQHGSWPPSWGEKPGQEGCQVPAELLQTV